MTEQKKEKHISGLIDAVIRLKAEIDSLSDSSGLIEITVTHGAKQAIDFVFYDVSSFYCGKQNLHSPVESLVGVKLKKGN